MAGRKKLRPMKRKTVTVDPNDYTWFCQLAQQSDVTASRLVRRLMREFLDRHAKEGVIALEIGPMQRTTGGH